MKNILVHGFILCSLLCVGRMIAGESREGKFTVTTSLNPPAAKQPGAATRWTVTVLARNGVELYRVEKQVPYGSPFPGTAVMDHAGELLLVDAFAGFVEFYDGSGALVRSWMPFGDAAPDHERILKCSAAGDRAAFVVSSAGQPLARVVMTTPDGEILWTRTLEEPSASEIILSDDGQGVIVSSYVMTASLRASSSILSRTGKTLAEVPLLMRHADFDGATGRWVIADGNEVRSGVTGKSAPEGTWITGGPAVIVTDVRLTVTGIILLAEGVEVASDGIRYANAALIGLDSAGMESFRREVQGMWDGPGRIGLRSGTGEGGAVSPATSATVIHEK